MDVDQRIDKYRIKRLLKKGGMASVYLAEHELLKKTLALKILPPELLGDQAYVERFLREARAAASLDHPHIIRIHDVGCTEGTYYIAMDLVEGPTLREVIQERAPLPVDEILSISDQVLTALSLAHKNHIIHRDLKPQNIMFNSQGEIVVMDFGIAKAADDVDLTLTGMFIGTARYASPEQVRGHGVDPRSDLYAWALVMFEMATGKRPERFTPPQPEALRRQIRAPLAAVVAKGLAWKPEDRFSTADEMRSALSAATEETVNHAQTTSTLPPETLTALQLPSMDSAIARYPKDKKAWYLRTPVLRLVAISAIFGLATLGWWKWPPTHRPRPQATTTIAPQKAVAMADRELRVWSEKPTYRVGEKLHLYYRATRDGYLFLYHQGADGDTQQIFPLSTNDDNFITAQLTYTIPDPSHNFNYLASPPLGQDRILAYMIPNRDEALAWQSQQVDRPEPPLEALTEKLVLTVVE
jgi:serine/threonine protein kinase